MKYHKLPVLISIPHGGTEVPKEVQHLFRLDPQEVLRDGDTWTRQVYDFKSRVLELVDTRIPRVVIDLNRDTTDLPPENFDGVVKTRSVFQNQVWDSPQGLKEEVRTELIEKYYQPYYQKVLEALKNPSIKLGIDCHSMLPKDPFNDKAEERPLFCISNRGGTRGEMLEEPLSAPKELLQAFKGALEQEFGHGSVELNNPFSGGYITRFFGQKNDVPWIQLEVNRSLYLPPEGLIPPTPEGEDEQNVKKLNRKIFNAIKSLKL